MPAGTTQRRWAHRPATDEEARALASGLRLQILRLTLDEALTNKEIAVRLGRNPASVLHHVRALVDTGFLIAEPVRRGTRGAREQPYRATGKSWYLTSPVTDRAILDAFLAEAGRVPVEDLHLTRLGLRLPPDQWQEFLERLHALLAEFAERTSDPAQEPWSVFVAVHPDAGRRPPAS
jgi:DNA-binding transcriptional ArsR family regulator